MYCHESVTSTNAAMSQSSLEAQLAKMLVMLGENYNYQSFIFEVIVGIDCCSFSSLPRYNQNYAQPLRHQSVARKKYTRNNQFGTKNVLFYTFSPYSNIVGYNANTKIRKMRFRYVTWY
jgi:hypothetical protein